MDQQTNQEPVENQETQVARQEEEKVNLNQLEQIAAQQREEALEQEDEKALEEAHSDAEPTVERTSAQELTDAEVQELSALDRLQIVERLESLYEQKKLEEAKNVVALLRLKYKEKTGVVKKEALDRFVEEGGSKIDFHFADSEEERFAEVSRKIREYHQKKREDQERLMAENLTKKKELLEQLKGLVEGDERPLKAIYDDFTKLTEKWREIKPIARAESNNLWQNYHFLVEKFFDKVRINNELRELDFKKNLEEKLQLCEKAESLLAEESIGKASKELHDLHDRWKEIGPVAMDKKDEIWDRFKAASDAIAQKRKDYYDSLQAEMEQNLLAKRALCEKAEGLLTQACATAKEWNALSDQVDELMKLWKSIGRAPQSENDAVWERFRGSLNTFFEEKKAFFRKIRDDQNNNYNLKVDLCVRAENIAQNRVDYRAATADLLKLQQEWKTVGPVPMRLSDKVWKRFRAACDEFFKKKADYYQSMRSDENANKEAKEALVAEVKALAVENREALLAAVKELQRRWTEIGHVPMKDKDRLYADFRAAIDEKFKVFGPRPGGGRDYSEINTPEDAALLSNKDIAQLNTRIQRIKGDITLWENNMGFISQAKSSDVLRREFENKIRRAKEELALLEAKMKIIRTKPAQSAKEGENA
ncbi:MAG: DUF349 domain-containing protein [Bacteroides sp.]|nr:DUF349 domain-containing protein [Bacteroides sp.]MCM1530902.1 DUF349 domain-containing protein [Ruminococcus flavefaciens]MCM1553948.1 DUF349 domain-containing protein [Bacteroides sp.]